MTLDCNLTRLDLLGMDVPSSIALRGVINISSMTTTVFHVQVVKTFLAELLYKKKFPLATRKRQAKTLSQLVNLDGPSP